MRRASLALAALAGCLVLAAAAAHPNAAGLDTAGEPRPARLQRRLLFKDFLPFGKGKGAVPVAAPVTVTPVYGTGTTLVPQKTTQMVDVSAARAGRGRRESIGCACGARAARRRHLAPARPRPGPARAGTARAPHARARQPAAPGPPPHF